MAKVGDRIFKWRLRRRLTQTAIARALGWHKSKVCRIELGHQAPSLEDLGRLAWLLRCRVRALLDE